MSALPTPPAWSQRMTAGWALVIGLVLLALAGVFAAASSPWIGLAVLPAAVLVLLFVTVRVMVDARGLTVEYGPASWPRTTIAMGEIVHADVVHVRPMSWGGWGYRGGLRLFGAAAVVIRRGEAIEVTRSDDRRFLVTVDDAAGGVAALQQLSGRRITDGAES